MVSIPLHSIEPSNLAQHSSRRKFLLGSSQLSAGIAVTALTNPIAALAQSNSSPTLSELLKNPLYELGRQIALQTVERFGQLPKQLILNFLDFAGPDLDALRQGFEAGLREKSQVTTTELQRPYGKLLGLAMVSNPATGETVQVEIFNSALSQLAYEPVGYATTLHSQQASQRQVLFAAAPLSIGASGHYRIS